jgi:hypothetical protein
MTFKDLLPIITALIGGMLAVTGGFISNYLLKSKDKENEKREFYREQLEQIYLLSGQLVDWTGVEYTELLSPEHKDNKEKHENPLTRLLMIVNLYHPSLKEHTKKIELCLDDFHNGTGEFFLHVLEERTDLPRHEVFKKYVDEPFQRLKEIRKDLLVAVEQQVNKYI